MTSQLEHSKLAVFFDPDSDARYREKFCAKLRAVATKKANLQSYKSITKSDVYYLESTFIIRIES